MTFTLNPVTRARAVAVMPSACHVLTDAESSTRSASTSESAAR